MKIHIYYGGRGLLDDPTLYIINKMQEVLTELRVEVERFNIHEYKNTISTLPQTLKNADGVIFATTVEWLGIGGYMQQFLDACWLYGDKQTIKNLYMQPVVMSTTYGEREGVVTLENAWDILGGLPCDGLCAYVNDLVAFEMNEEYSLIIEKKAESLYRSISQKMRGLPTSNQAVTENILRRQTLDLTPQETEQLSKYVADDTYVKKQKEDIEELASMFKGMMGETEKETGNSYVTELKSHFVANADEEALYELIIEDRNAPLMIDIKENQLNCYYKEESTAENADVYIKISTSVMEKIIYGQMTFQRAFMTGEMTAKGNFKTLRMLDNVFIFDATNR